MAKPEKFVYVCVNQRPEGHPRGSCSMHGAREVITKFSESIEGQGLSGRVSLIQSGCMGPCNEGPVVAVFPDNVWYRGVAVGDVGEIVSEHLEGDKPVTRLLLDDRDW